MGIGLSDGSYYDDEFAYASRNFVNLPSEPEKPTGKSSDIQATPLPTPTIDRTHDVPLAATALMHDDGTMYGVAVDKDIPSSHTFDGHTYDPAMFVAQHEAAEHAHMKNLIIAGQNPVDAYKEAHDKIATPTETAAVRAYASANGKDPDAFMDDYKQFWRDGAAKAAEPPFDRHPDAHTTKFGLDEDALPQHFEGTTPVRSDWSILKQNFVPWAKSIIPRAVEGAENYAQRANQAMSGQLSEKEMISFATDTAMGMVGGPGTFAGKMEAGTLRSFAGVMSEKADLNKMGEAIKMSVKDVNPKKIFNDTGWYKDVDNEWKYEISNKEAKIHDAVPRTNPAEEKPDSWTSAGTSTSNEPKVTLNNEFGITSKLPDVLDHPELYKAYPMLKDVEVAPMGQHGIDQGYKGWYDDDNKLIAMSPAPEKEFLSTLLHEVQHSIQAHENFGRGGNPNMFQPGEVNTIRPEFEAKEKLYSDTLRDSDLGMNKEGVYHAIEAEVKGIKSVAAHQYPGKTLTKDFLNRLEEFYKGTRDKLQKANPTLYENFKNLYKINDLIDESDAAANKAYKSLAGEAESRNVQTRQRKSDFYNKLTHPLETLDIPKDEIIVTRRR